MVIVIPMAGLSQRFLDAGYTLPKYMLYAGNRSLFNISVSSFSQYFKNSYFLFIARDLYDTGLFIRKECELMQVSNYSVALLDKPTKGQAETVFMGLEMTKISDDEPVTIFNIDTIRHGFKFPEDINQWDGFLDVFRGGGINWSYARTENEHSTRVVETAEKVPISEYCSTGLYYFKSTKLYKDAYLRHQLINGNNAARELYIAPIYNILIRDGFKIHINLIDRSLVSFCGVPDEYNDYLRLIHTQE